MSLNTEKFIQKAIAIHGNKYEYSISVYIGSAFKIKIICPIHGTFIQVAGNHLNKYGCPKCAALKFSLERRSNKQEFINKAKLVHGDKYDYSKVVYINSRTKITIICHKHGEFEQTPFIHLRGSNCPICRSSKGELIIKAILDKHNIESKQEYRIPQIANKLYYDFYLPKYNLLIEFHGKQHYEYVPFLHNNDEDNFLAQKTRDDIKKSNARDFRYRFIEFNYKQLKLLSKEQFEKILLINISQYVAMKKKTL